MDKYKLKASHRDIVGKSSGKLKIKGLIPAVLYGKGKESQNLSVATGDFGHMYREVGTSSIVLLDIEDDGQKNVLVHDIDFHPVTDEPIHIDFYEVSMKEKITTTVPLRFVGDSKAVIEMSGSLMTNKTDIEIECLPGDLPPEVEVDISVLDDFEKSIHVSDLKLPEGVEVKADPEESIASVEAPRSEEEMAELEEPVSGEVPEEASEEGESVPETEAEENKETE